MSIEIISSTASLLQLMVEFPRTVGGYPFWTVYDEDRIGTAIDWNREQRLRNVLMAGEEFIHPVLWPPNCLPDRCLLFQAELALPARANGGANCGVTPAVRGGTNLIWATRSRNCLG